MNPGHPSDEIFVKRLMRGAMARLFVRLTAMKIFLDILRIAGYGALLVLAVPHLALAQTDPLSHSSSPIPVQPDPVPGRGADFSPSAATAIEAYDGQPRADLHNDCTQFNPCALASSAPHQLGPLVTELDVPQKTF